MVTFIDNHQAVARRKLTDVITAGEALHHDHVHHTFSVASTPTQLTYLLDIKIKMSHKAFPPLVDERLSIHDHQGRNPVTSDKPTADHRLARSRWGNQHAEVARDE